VGVNPKVNNLVTGYEVAQYNVVWICDSNVMIDRDCLTFAMNRLQDPTIGLVHHPPTGVQPRSYGARLEQFFLNTAHSKIYLVINALAIDSCVMGKSTLFRKSDLDRCGGLRAFGKYLAEDNMIGKAILDLGLKHQLSPLLATQPLGSLSVRDYILRRSRWTRIRVYMLPIIASIIEPVTESVFLGLLTSLCWSVVTAYSAMVFFVAHMVAWYFMDLLLFRYMADGDMGDLAWYTAAWIGRELSAALIFVYAAFGSNRVNWRGNLYRLRFGGIVEPIRRASLSSRPFFIDALFEANSLAGQREGWYFWLRTKLPFHVQPSKVEASKDEQRPASPRDRTTYSAWMMEDPSHSRNPGPHSVPHYCRD
jgi:ceramide glucosyltransferase